jgi:hypothetical protein
MILRLVAFSTITALLFVSSARAQYLLGINLGGDAVTINGNSWQSEATALSNGFSFNPVGAFVPFTYGATPSPAVDLVTATMLNDVRYVPSGFSPVSVHQTVPNGQAYIVELWTFEGYQSFARSADVSGDISTTDFDNLPLGGWEVRSLTTGIINDGSIDFTITTISNQPVLSGFAVFAVLPEPSTAMLAMASLALVGRRFRT